MLLLLLSRFSRVRLCATPETAAHPAPQSLEFSRQEHWSGLLYIYIYIYILTCMYMFIYVCIHENISLCSQYVNTLNKCDKTSASKFMLWVCWCSYCHFFNLSVYLKYFITAKSSVLFFWSITTVHFIFMYVSSLFLFILFSDCFKI